MIASRIVGMYGLIGEARHRATAEIKWLIATSRRTARPKRPPEPRRDRFPRSRRAPPGRALLPDTSLSRVTAAQCPAARAVTGAALAAGEPDEAAGLASRGIQESRRQILDDDRRVTWMERSKKRLHRHPLTQPFVCIVGRALK